MKTIHFFQISFCLTLSLYLLLNATVHAEQLNTVEKDGKIGLVNEEGTILIPYEYDALGWSKGPLKVINGVIAYKSNDLWGLISINNQLISKAEFLEIFPAQNNFLIAAKKGRFSSKIFYGVITVQGKQKVPFYYENIKAQNDFLIAAYRSKRQINFGLISYNNKIILPFQYYLLQAVSNHYLLATDSKGKKTLINQAGKQMLDFPIHSLELLNENYSLLHTASGYGLINSYAQIILTPQYKKMVLNQDGTLNTLKFEQWQIKEKENNLIRKYEADLATLINKEWICLSRNNFITLLKLDHSDSIQLEGKLKSYQKNLLAIEHKSTQIYDLAKKRYHEGRHDSVIFHQNLILTAKKKADSFIWNAQESSTKNTVLNDISDLQLNEGILLYRKNNQQGALLINQNKLLSNIYDSVKMIDPSTFLVQFQGKMGLLDENENWMIPPQMLQLKEVGNQSYLSISANWEYAIYKQNERLYLSQKRLTHLADDAFMEFDSSGNKRIINSQGEEIIAMTNDSLWVVNSDLIVIDRKQNKQVLYPAQQWDFIVDKQTEIISSPADGFILIKKDGKYGFIDHLGNLRIANRYDSALSFSEGKAAVKIRNGWGFIDQLENIIVQPLYKSAHSYQNDQSLVQSQNGLYGLIDANGLELIPTNYKQIIKESTIGFILSSGTKKGLANHQGELLLAAKYDELIPDKNGYVRIKRANKYGLISENGINTIPTEYDELYYDDQSGWYFTKKESSWDIKFKTDLKAISN